MDLLHLFHAGGFMMYPLVICSIIVVAIFIERFSYYHANKSNVKKLANDIPEFLSRNDIEGLKGVLEKDLVCTATGLFVAILSLIVYTYLSQVVARYVSAIEKLSSIYLSIVVGDKK